MNDLETNLTLSLNMHLGAGQGVFTEKVWEFIRDLWSDSLGEKPRDPNLESLQTVAMTAMCSHIEAVLM